MKYSFLLLVVLLGCANHEHNYPATDSSKDTILQTVWEIQDGDTVSGYAIRVIRGDTVIEDFGVNPSWSPKK